MAVSSIYVARAARSGSARVWSIPSDTCQHAIEEGSVHTIPAIVPCIVGFTCRSLISVHAKLGEVNDSATWKFTLVRCATRFPGVPGNNWQLSGIVVSTRRSTAASSVSPSRSLADSAETSRRPAYPGPSAPAPHRAAAWGASTTSHGFTASRPRACDNSHEP
jgi:hypothetical protein